MSLSFATFNVKSLLDPHGVRTQRRSLRKGMRTAEDAPVRNDGSADATSADERSAEAGRCWRPTVLDLPRVLELCRREHERHLSGEELSIRRGVPGWLLREGLVPGVARLLYAWMRLTGLPSPCDPMAPRASPKRRARRRRPEADRLPERRQTVEASIWPWHAPQRLTRHRPVLGPYSDRNVAVRHNKARRPRRKPPSAWPQNETTTRNAMSEPAAGNVAPRAVTRERSALHERPGPKIAHRKRRCGASYAPWLSA
jgi:hypothetical protein